MKQQEEDTLEVFHRLLERLHQAGYRALGSIVLNICKPGSRHVDREEKLCIGAAAHREVDSSYFLLDVLG